MPHQTLVDATDLASWATRRDAQSRLPQVVRRLVVATAQRATRVQFRAGEGVHLGGWDGITETGEATEFVPAGVSGWELGVDKDTKRKADDEYEGRKADPAPLVPAQSSFVFVTPRRWGKKEDWAATRAEEGLWRQVRAYDADDLETWLECAPAVHLWLSGLLGKRPDDSVDLETFWDEWSRATEPALSSDILLAGRDETTSRVHEWLRNPRTPSSIQAGTREEAVAILAASVKRLSDEEQEDLFSRAVVVSSVASWRRLAVTEKPLILIPLFEPRDIVAQASRRGHWVLIPLDRADSATDFTIDVSMLTREPVKKALVCLGVDEERAVDLASLARRSFTSFRRRIAMSPEVQQPKWARPEEAHNLLGAMLASRWADDSQGDREAVAALASRPYEEVSRILVRWSNEADPPVRQVGSEWMLLSKEDAWHLLARHLTKDDISRLEETALVVLGVPDPSFDLEAERRPMARIIGHAPKYSDEFREGLADTLAVMGARSAAAPASSGFVAEDYAACIVRRLLEQANNDWRVWASLSQLLPQFAEAAPDVFLDAVDVGLQGNSPVLLNLFTEQEHLLFGSSPHTGLLWALETLAWCPDRLGHVALILAKLARLDPGGNLANRPNASLRQTFLPWLPQTKANLQQRLQVLDMLREREPRIAWPLLRSLLPESHSIGTYAPKPRWREWALSDAKVMQGEYVQAIREITGRMLSDIGEDGARWRDILCDLPSLLPDQYEAVVTRLEALALFPEELADDARAAVWNGLRELISRHRSFTDASWALPKAEVDRLEASFRRFEPEDPVARFGWLFTDSPQLPEGKEQDFAAHGREVAERRLRAVQTLYAGGGLGALVKLAASVERPYDIGLALGESGLHTDSEDTLLAEYLASGNAIHAFMARGFVSGRIRRQGREWAEGKLSTVRALGSVQRAELLVCLPYDRAAVDLVASQGPETDREYWLRVHPCSFGDSPELAFVLGKLLKHGRPYDAIDLLGVRRDGDPSVSPELIADVLERAVQVQPDGERRPGPSFSFHVSELFTRLAASSGGVAEERIARLECVYLPHFARRGYTPRLLHRELSRSPSFFAEVIALVYGVEGEEQRKRSQSDQARAQHGDTLLKSWRAVPGASEDGTPQAAALKAWVRKARKLTAASGHGAIGECKIGEVLSGSPSGADGAWPHEAIRDIVEEVQSSHLEIGLATGLYNSRGVISRDPYEGGDQEWTLEQRYSNYAATICNRWPRTAAMLRRIADWYGTNARREDQEADLLEDGIL